MKKRAAIKLLAAPEDQGRLQGVLKQLRARGVRISAAKGAFRKKDIVLAVLSEHFYGDEALRSQLFQQLALGSETVLPLNLGNGPVPEDIMNLLFARNIITVSGRDDAQVAERILAALPEKRNHLPLILAVAAVVLVLLGGLYLWHSTREPEVEPVIQEETPVVYPWGLTEEDLAKIQDVIIIGDYFAYFTYEDYQEAGAWPEIYDFAYETWDDDGRHWYSTEDGHEYTLTRYDDLRFLELMPNLRRLRMVLAEVETDMLPDLRGSTRLNNVSIHDCGIRDVEWMAADFVSTVDITGTDIADYSPLSQCDSLWYAYIDGLGEAKGDVSGLAPPALQELYLSNLQTEEIDLSGLVGCTRLSRLTLDSLPITDLSFLESRTGLQSLTLNFMPRLRDISAVSALRGLAELRITHCDAITDYTPISSCKMLRCIGIDRAEWIPMDSAFLDGLTYLNDIGLFGLNLNNLNFLENLNQKYNICLGFAGDIQDYSGLAAINHYGWIHVNPRWNDNDYGYGDFSLVEPYLQNVSVSDIELFGCTNVDLAKLPKISGKLTITSGDLENLEGLSSEYLIELELRNMQYLRTLDGVEGLNRSRNGMLRLNILGCPRLTDYAALNGTDLYSLNFVDTYAIPDFSEINVHMLCLESIAGMENLSCLETLNRDRKYHFKFLGMDDLKDLSMLRNFKGTMLQIPPQVADQAQELVDQGNFSAYEVSYPESGWNPLTEEITLLSLEELEILPKAVLRRVGRVWIAGDEIIDPGQYEVWDEWTDYGVIPVLYDRETGQKRPVNPGTITDFSMLSDLTGLRELRIFNQPLTNLEGIQYFTELRWFEAKFCRDLTDVSALYTQQSLMDVSLPYTGISSIQGVQNLPQLQCLRIYGTQVTDLSVLAELDYSAALENGGFNLEINQCSIEDLSYLRAIPAFSNLNLCGYPAESWMEYLEEASIRCICSEMGSDESLKRFVQQHPELEEIHIEAGYQLTDLTPLLELDNLHYVHIWDRADAAGNSLNGYERRFHLDVD